MKLCRLLGLLHVFILLEVCHRCTLVCQNNCQTEIFSPFENFWQGKPLKNGHHGQFRSKETFRFPKTSYKGTVDNIYRGLILNGNWRNEHNKSSIFDLTTNHNSAYYYFNRDPNPQSPHPTCMSVIISAQRVTHLRRDEVYYGSLT